MIIAKPIVKDQFWILQKNQQKIGNVQAVGDGYRVCINNLITQFKTMRMLAQQEGIQFEKPTPSVMEKNMNMVHGFPAPGRVYNAVWNMQYRLPLYTKTRKSKCWFAAGWYRVQRGKKWQVIQAAKLIMLQRYTYHGPFMTQTLAQ